VRFCFAWMPKPPITLVCGRWRRDWPESTASLIRSFKHAFLGWSLETRSEWRPALIRTPGYPIDWPTLDSVLLRWARSHFGRSREILNPGCLDCGRTLLLSTVWVLIMTGLRRSPNG